MIPEEKEMSVSEVMKRLWDKRKFILKVTLIFISLGILIALFSAKEYTANCTVVPQTGEKTTGGSISGLAAMAGISLGNTGGGDVLSPKIYPRVLTSIPFQKELMQMPVKLESYDAPVRLVDYFTEKKYQKFSLSHFLYKYTVGLPGVIMQTMRGEQPEMIVMDSLPATIQTLSKEESQCMKILQSRVSIALNEKDGYVILSASMPEPMAAAQLASGVQCMLQKYITEFKIEKAQANLDFIEGRYAEAKQQFERLQEELAVFRDANRNFASAMAKTFEERLSNEYNLAFGVYSELAKQREQASIQVKENTPIFTVVEPVTVPTERSKPKRGLICIAFTFLGIFVGIALVLLLPFIAKVTGVKCLKKWLPEKNEK